MRRVLIALLLLVVSGAAQTRLDAAKQVKLPGAANDIPYVGSSGVPTVDTGNFTYDPVIGELAAKRFRSNDTVNNTTYAFRPGSGGDSTCEAPTAGQAFMCWRNNRVELTNDGAPYSGIITQLDLDVQMAKARQFCVRKGEDNGPVLVDTDDGPAVHISPVPWTITKVRCLTDMGTSTINFQRNDGTPANILSSDLTCTNSGANGTIDTNEDNLAIDNVVDFVMVTAAVSGTPHRVTVCVSGTED